jgi:hypothetical protein
MVSISVCRVRQTTGNSDLLAGDGASDYQWNDIHIDEYDCGPISSSVALDLPFKRTGSQ